MFKSTLPPGSLSWLSLFASVLLLDDTTNPTRFDYFQPGMHTKEQSAELISHLDLQPPSTILLESSFAEKISSAWPGTPLGAIANDPVTGYTSPVPVLCSPPLPAGWRFLYMVRNSLSCPLPG